MMNTNETNAAVVVRVLSENHVVRESSTGQRDTMQLEGIDNNSEYVSGLMAACTLLATNLKGLIFFGRVKLARIIN